MRNEICVAKVCANKETKNVECAVGEVELATMCNA